MVAAVSLLIFCALMVDPSAWNLVLLSRWLSILCYSRLDQMVGLGCMELSNGPGLESNDPIMLIL